MTVTIHFAGHDPGALVRDLTAFAHAAGVTVRTSSAGVVVPDDLARRWLTAQGPNGAAPAAIDEPDIQVAGGVSIQTWRPDPPPEPDPDEAPAATRDGWTPARRAAYEARRRAQQTPDTTEAPDG
jgi:hypothetical protein